MSLADRIEDIKTMDRCDLFVLDKMLSNSNLAGEDRRVLNEAIKTRLNELFIVDDFMAVNTELTLEEAQL